LRSGTRHAAQLAIAASKTPKLTVVIGIAKSPVRFVTRPTAHIANAPTNEPEPLSSPAAVETRVKETSCAIVKYIAFHTPIPKLTATNTAAAKC
jgi:hypothetical protein